MTALYKILPMAIMQSAMLAGGQVFLVPCDGQDETVCLDMVFLRQSAHQLAVRSLWLVLPLCLVAVDAYAQGVPIELGISFVVIELRLRHGGCHRLLS